MAKDSSVSYGYKTLLKLVSFFTLISFLSACGSFGGRGGGTGKKVIECAGLEEVGFFPDVSKDEIIQIESMGYNDCVKCLNENMNKQEVCFYRNKR